MWYPTSTDASMTVVEREVAVQSSVFVTFVTTITQVSLLTRTDMTAITAVLNRVRRLTSWRIIGTLARVHALAAR